ncbi:MAG TPA: hypothetical protein VMV86_03010 [Methanosarcinales archaeon]|nr:hypothetical protein [Methanosarcinales archaeon]
MQPLEEEMLEHRYRYRADVHAPTPEDAAPREIRQYVVGLGDLPPEDDENEEA